MKRLILLMCLPLIAVADQETKLVVKLEKAQRAVEKANKKSDSEAAVLVAYCKSQGKVLQVKPNGLMGCVVPQPAPTPTPAPPTEAKPEPAKTAK